MAKEIGKFRAILEYVGARTAAAGLAYLPFFLSKRLAYFLGDVWRTIDRRHEKLVIDQSMDRLGIDADAAKRLARANYRHYALFAVEFCRLGRLSPEQVMRRIDVRDTAKTMTDLLAEGNGLVVLTGHLGNWEYGSTVMGALKLADGFIARPLDNPLIDAYVNRIRGKTGAEVWEKQGSMRHALAALRKGRSLVAVVDQDGGRLGCKAPFLGKDSSTMIAPIDLAIRKGSPLYVAAMMRRADYNGFEFVGKRVHRPIPGADPEEERRRLAIAVNEDLGEIIREYPEQWIWIHRRWRTVL